jgi:hypothetical protein
MAGLVLQAPPPEGSRPAKLSRHLIRCLILILRWRV